MNKKYGFLRVGAVVPEIKVANVTNNVDEIINLYREYTRKYFDLNYSVANSGKKSEVMFLSQDSLCPTDTELKQNNIRINIRGEIQNDN